MELTKEQIIEGNKLLAEFMDYGYIPFNNDQKFKAGWWKKDTTEKVKLMEPHYTKMGKSNYLCRNNNELRYYNEWNWIMEVVDKIESFGYRFKIDTKYVWCFFDNDWKESRILYDKLTTVFEVCVAFVKWYNYEDN